MIDRQARERVLAIVDLARRIADGRDPLGEEARVVLRRTSGLSEAGVELALAEHLETSPTEEDLSRLQASVGQAPRCHVVLASNVCTAAVRCLALAAATAPEVTVRPSTRDPGLGPLLVRELAASARFRNANGSVIIVESLEAKAGDDVHAYGTDASIAAIAASLPAGVVFRGHGTGFGLAFIGSSTDLEATATLLARDVTAFDQRGCLSPRLALVSGDVDRGRSFARALLRSLAAAALVVPRGALDETSAAEAATFRSLAEGLGERYEDRDCLVAFFPGAPPLPLPPAARMVSVAAVGDEAACEAVISPYRQLLTTVGLAGADDAARPLLALASVRFSELGKMQCPPLDGPVDRRGPRR